ncbi:hypothetical protein C4D60_Mb10t25580 [Musa balbisiana]|uniref:Trehalose 6-phosphate phosphatase n=1 Tax=Musa balbisiana TaxID=52838 RepID=A0A4S8IZV8_MUSBA|nr:hypothetical protein C4D60_Mb10t25580 [Musa balbisiana]
MMNQNVVVQAITVAAVANSPPLFTYPPPRASGSSAAAAIPKKYLSPVELGGGWTNGWLEAMKASSPTHAKSTLLSAPAVVSEQDEQSAWMMRHPSALSKFEQITSATTGKQIVMFLDYDGTLSPIVDDPDSAFMSDTKKAVLFQPASEFLPLMNEIHKALLETTRSIAGAKVENNKFCVSVHFRCVDEKCWGVLVEQVVSLLKKYPELRLTQGRKVLEIRPTIKWDKGKALEFLLKSLGFADNKNVVPIYIGDDHTDEDAFKVLRDRGQGIGILVSEYPKDTNASYSLKEPYEVMEFLLHLVEWKRHSLKALYKVDNTALSLSLGAPRSNKALAGRLTEPNHHGRSHATHMTGPWARVGPA